MSVRSTAKRLLLPAFLVLLASCSMFQGQETSGQYVDDATITAKVKEAFVADAKISSMQISVETMQGTVQLSGFVTSKGMEKRAVQIATQVQGVKSVTDNMQVQPANYK